MTTPQQEKFSPKIGPKLDPNIECEELITIVIPCKNENDNIYECVGFIAKQVGSAGLKVIIADNSGNPSFGGAYPLNSNWFLDKVTALRNIGGDVIISFGGAAGSELAAVDHDINSLAQSH